MNPIEKALWFIEVELGCKLDLDRIASICGLSKFHLSRLFALNTGVPVMRYVRARRLALAAKKLAQGAPDILSIALDTGYGSHEAFTRAFVEHFGITPERVRANRDLVEMSLTEPQRMKEMKLIELESPRFEQAGVLNIAGVSARFTFETNEGIPALWRTFVPHIGHIPGQVGWTTYGVCFSPDAEGGFSYLAGVQVEPGSRVGVDLQCIELGPQEYAVFRHNGHVSTLHQSFYTIWNDWLPKSGLRGVDAPEFEKYSEDFDPVAGTGSIEIWLPVERGSQETSRS